MVWWPALDQMWRCNVADGFLVSCLILVGWWRAAQWWRTANLMRHGRLKSLPTTHHGACVFLLRRGRVKYATVDTSWTRCAPVRARIFVRIPVSSLFLLRGLNQMLHYNSPAPLALALTPTPLALTPAPNALEVQVSSVKYSSYLPLLFFLGKI